MKYNLWFLLYSAFDTKDKELWRLQSWHSNGAHRGLFYRFRSGTVTALRLNTWTSHHTAVNVQESILMSGPWVQILHLSNRWVTSSHRMISAMSPKGKLSTECVMLLLRGDWPVRRLPPLIREPPHLTSRCFTATAGPTLLRPPKRLQHPPNGDIMISRLSVKSSDQEEAVLVLHASTEISFRCRQIVFIPCTSCISWN